MICLPPNFTNGVYVVCLVAMLLIKGLKDKFRTVTPSARKSRTIRRLITFISILDLINVTVWYNTGNKSIYLIYPWFTNLLRPFLAITVMEGVRRFSIRYLRVMQGSMPMVIFILLFVMYFAWVG